ncbi:LOW QUALITY PROTEIN: mitotic checkpoint serine/threonine-protein kinase BUB1-like [Embiotoca jacksoni]|uniref:LOW QUALITY PROTEIN: mitotic checkpoint serine/threonine-protein kinase BUB1-like n=1 Tax=Embiotoca jacksoni TaxID=100190 RepID=UPI0037046044
MALTFLHFHGFLRLYFCRCFEDSLSSYTGDDPLDPWDKLVEYLEQMRPAEGGGMSLVLDSLVQRFLNVERYANDVRYVNYCIKCARHRSDPVAPYGHVFGRGVGGGTAAPYAARARRPELRGTDEQADAVDQKAVENRARPADAVLHEYRRFQTRTRIPAPASAGRTALQNSHLTDQMSSDGQAQSVPSVECPLKMSLNRTTVTVSRSETSGTIPSGRSSGVQNVSEYLEDELVCEGSQLCFEEVRAQKYFRKLQERREEEEEEEEERRETAEKEQKEQKEQREQKEGAEGAERGSPQPDSSVQQNQPPVGTRILPSMPLGCTPSRPSSTRPPNLLLLLLLLLSRQTLCALRFPIMPLCRQMRSRRSTNPPMFPTRTPENRRRPTARSKTSVNRQQSRNWTGSKPPVHQQAPPPFCPSQLPVTVPTPPSLSLRLPQCLTAGRPTCLASLPTPGWASFRPRPPGCRRPPSTGGRRWVSTTVGWGGGEEVKLRCDQGHVRGPDVPPRPVRRRLGAPRRRAGVGRRRPDERRPLLVHQPPSAAPFTIFQDNNHKQNGSAAARPTEKSKPVRGLAPVAPPKADKPNDTPPDPMPDESTMWGARYNSLHSLAACPNSTLDFAMLAQCVSTPFTHKTPLSGNFYQDPENNGGDADDDAFIRRQTQKLSPIREQSPTDDKLSETAVSQLVPSSARQGTIVGEGLAQHCLATSSVTSSITVVQPPRPAVLSFRDQTLCPADSSGTSAASARPGSEPFQITEEPDEPAYDVPMSPECALKPDWLSVRSPEAAVEPDPDAFVSPCRPGRAVHRNRDVPVSPEQPRLCADEPVMSPHGEPSADVSMNAATAAVHLVSDPWDDQLISGLLASLTPPLSAHPCCVSWRCGVPSFSPGRTLSMGKKHRTSSLRVDGVLGEGAFATVYQATNPVTSEKVVLKVQKPANPWEFYIHTQPDARLQPAVRHLYGRVSSAHLFHDGSVPVGELHDYGTLLKAVNVYKSLSDEAMPPPLVLYFSVCILHTLERPHAARIVHADVKPDNFLLGERFLENSCFDPDGVDHGLVLIDLGQSIDMRLFPEGTAFTARCLTSGFQCTEMLSGKPWSYQTDYFGFAGTVHRMLFGTYMQVTNDGGVWKTNGVFGRNTNIVTTIRVQFESDRDQRSSDRVEANRDSSRPPGTLTATSGWTSSTSCSTCRTAARRRACGASGAGWRRSCSRTTAASCRRCSDVWWCCCWRAARRRGDDGKPNHRNGFQREREGLKVKGHRRSSACLDI